MTDWPFDIWLNFAVRRLGLSPETFWNMPLADWLLLTAPMPGQALSRAELADLMNLYPDESET